MALHRILKLEGPYLAAAVVKCAHPSWHVQLSRNNEAVECWVGIPHPDHRTNVVTFCRYGDPFQWALFGPIYERHHDLINLQMCTWYGPNWNIEPPSFLTSLARAFVKATLCQYRKDDLVYEIELPEVTPLAAPAP